VLLVVFLMVHGSLHWTTLFLPLVIFPLVIAILGFSWILASLGVYLRDVSHTVGILTAIAMFLAPVFYPLSALPERYRPFMQLNPVTFIIEQSRSVIIFGEMPNWFGLLFYLIVASGLAWFGFWWFQKTRRGFADVM
jgi:lipopolysaccharide transport system permease protein